MYGPQPDWRQRAIYVEYASDLIEAVVIAVGSALSQFYGSAWYRATILPMQRDLHALAEALPIDANQRAAFS